MSTRLSTERVPSGVLELGVLLRGDRPSVPCSSTVIPTTTPSCIGSSTAARAKSANPCVAGVRRAGGCDQVVAQCVSL